MALAGFVAGFCFRGSAPETAAAAPRGRRVLYWHDPMHPAYRSDKPGIAPDCGMQLEPVYEGGGDPRHAAPTSPGAVTIAADRQQLIGVRVGQAEAVSSDQKLRLLGRVTVDETRIYRLFAATDGWVREISSQAPGNIVQKDELLATYFSRDVITPQNSYLYALATRDRTKASDAGQDQNALANSQVRGAEDSLVNLGMSVTQIRELEKSRAAGNLMQVRAPEAGVILARNISHNLRLDRSAELYRLADIRRVYVLADVYGRDAMLIPVGTRAQVRYEDRVLTGDIANALPLFDAASRTFKVRLEVDNPGFLLRPDMFVDVEIPVRLPPAVTVPADAVLDSGTRRVVFVPSGPDSFEPREVETGWRFGGRVAVTRGLQAGQSVVIAGTFLLDSESRLSLAAHTTTALKPGAVKDSVCGMEVDPSKALKLDRQGPTYSFCSESCRKKFRRPV